MPKLVLSLLCCVSLTEMGSFTLSDVDEYYKLKMQNPGKPEIDPLAGIIFHPKDEEIITILNYKKSGSVVHSPIFMKNIYEREPSEIPGLAIQTGGKWWNFFCVLEALDDSGKRFRRSTITGYWKSTGDPVKIKAKGTNEVIGEKRTLVFHERHRGGSKGRCKEVRTNWVMREYSAYANNDPPSKDLVICRVKFKKDKKRRIPTKNENKRAKKRLVSANDEGQPSHYVPVDNRNHVTKISSPKLRLQPSCHLISTSVSHDVADTSSPQWQLIPSSNLISNSGSDAVENAYPSVSNTNSHALEDTSQVDPYPSIFNSNNRDTEDTSQVEPLLVENPTALNGSTGLEQTSFSTLQLPNPPEQGSSYFNDFSNENYVLNSVVSEWDHLPQFASPSPHEFDLHQFLGEEAIHGTYSSFVTPTY